MEDIIDIIVTETTNTIEITAQPNDEIIDVNIIDNREDITLNVTPTLVEVNINSLVGNFGINWGEITGTLSNQTDLNTALGLKADLVGGKVPSSQLPSYVDDVVEVANYASLPATGESGKIYITIDTNYIYRWTGSVYVEIKDSSAVWGAITGTLSNQTDLQSALNAKLSISAAASTYVPYTGATADVNLGLNNFDANQINGLQIVAKLNGTGSSPLVLKTGTSGYSYGNDSISLISSPTSANTLMVISDVSSVTKIAEFAFGSLTTTRTFTLPDASGTLALTSQLHNAVTIGTANGLSLSTQVLSLGLASSSANGALSSTDWSTFNGKQNALSGTGFVKISGTTISYDNSTYLTTSSAASTYVPYTGANSAVNLGAYDLTVNGIKIGRGAGSIADNTVVGSSALTSNTTGSSNTAIGFSTLSANTIAGANTAVGTYALSSNVSGGTNTAIGYSAGSSITTGSNNVIIGGYAGTSAMSGNVILSDGGGNIRFQWDGTNIKLNGNTVGSNAFTSTAYLPLSGGTLTGALSGTSASFSDTITSTLAGHSARGLYFTANQPSGINWYDTDDVEQYSMGIIANSGAGYWGLWSSTSSTAIDRSTTTPIFKIARAGAATFSSSVTASGAKSQFVADGGASSGAGISLNTSLSGTDRRNWFIGTEENVAGDFVIKSSNAAGGNANSGTTRIQINNNGNVGIGTTNPIIALSVRKDTNDWIGQFKNYGAVAYGLTVDLSGSTGSTAGYALGVYTQTGTGMFVRNDGSVGIGTTSPGQKLSVAGKISFAAYETDQDEFGFWTTTGTTGGVTMSTAGATNLLFRSNNAERMRITSGGDVCIASTTPVSSRRELRIGGNAAGSRISLGLNGTNYSALVTDSGGNVYLTNEYNDSAIKLLMINYNNGVYLSQSATSWTSNSDERLKTDLVAIENATEKVASLRSVIGRYKTDDESKRRPFLIAQDVYSVLPEAVDIDQKTGMMGVQYTEVIPLLVASIKELKLKIETLENK